ncbi:uncharacterized protein LOC129598868 [Paramacrobiotus metropolitanus]|uniref:uncharacterized protein LOC129598868 n=1 Tax=Paramacrobiotus metropolitanus TaxID=2943436 RepID=UPI0024462ACF|nr:uncharacterized protein LOC129598868 [Paramacrobiotus metropolitanus]
MNLLHISAVIASFCFAWCRSFREVATNVGDLEVDCHKVTQPSASLDASVVPAPFAFRTDNLTKAECLAYLAFSKNSTILCNPVFMVQECDEDHSLSYPLFSRTYLRAGCAWANRTNFAQVTKNIKITSPNRAVTLEVREFADMEDLLHHDVMDPVRHQVIDLVIEKCATTITTAKLYDAGPLPNLVRLRMENCFNMVIKKRDFARIPAVRMITFYMFTIETLEEYTFTDLLHLDSLVLEDGIVYELRRIQEYPNPPRRQQMVTLTDADIEKVRRIHCDCSLAWFRNFLKRRPYLTDGKEEGEVSVVGNYRTPIVNTIKLAPAVLSVDCARNLTYNSARVGSVFSYNTSCYGPC